MMTTLLRVINGFTLAYMLALNSVHALLLLLSMPELWSHWQSRGRRAPDARVGNRGASTGERSHTGA